METRRLGRTNLEVSRIGFGGMTITPWFCPDLTVEQGAEVVNTALDLGVNFVDTARAYPGSEEKIGRVMKARRHECYLSTRSPKMDYEGMKADIETSLRTLQTDHIDIYEPHDVSTRSKYEDLLSPNGAVKALKEARKAGKIRFIGVTGHNWELLYRLIETDEFDAALVVYNLADREAEKEVIPLAGSLDVGLFVMKVFGNARLPKQTPPGEERRPTVEECLRFALSNRDFPLILTGVRSPEEMKENVSIAESRAPLTDEEREELAAFGDSLRTGYCYSCNYCLPCPEEIDIPRIMQLLGNRDRRDWHTVHPRLYREYRELDRTFDDCADCGECEERCPQNLPIRERLEKAKEVLDKEV